MRAEQPHEFIHYGVGDIHVRVDAFENHPAKIWLTVGAVCLELKHSQINDLKSVIDTYEEIVEQEGLSV